MNYDQEYYYERMAETYAGLTGFRPNPASDVAFRFRALAVQLSALAGQIEEARLGAFPATASGKTLDAHAALRGLSRREACRGWSRGFPSCWFPHRRYIPVFPEMRSRVRSA